MIKGSVSIAICMESRNPELQDHITPQASFRDDQTRFEEDFTAGFSSSYDHMRAVTLA